MKRLWGKIQEAAAYIGDLHVPVYAAHAGYFMILSLFPMLVLLMGLLRYTGIDVNNLVNGLRGAIPEALLPSAKKLILNTYQGTSGMVISVSAVIALWSASKGIYGLQRGLNAIYHVQESRGYFYTRAISMVYTVLFLAVLLVTLLLGVFGNTLVHAFPAGFLANIVDLHYIPLLLLQTALFTGIFTVLPNGRNKLWESLPGAVFSSVGWLAFSALYSVYVDHFSGFATVYGSVYAVALSMLWLYCCISIVFYGGALNYYLKNRKK